MGQLEDVARAAAQRRNICLKARRALANLAALSRSVTAVVKSITFIALPATALRSGGNAIYAGQQESNLVAASALNRRKKDPHHLRKILDLWYKGGEIYYYW